MERYRIKITNQAKEHLTLIRDYDSNNITVKVKTL